MEIINSEVRLDFRSLRGRGVWRYRDAIPGNYPTTVSMGEGDTPLIRDRNRDRLYYKFEGANPTGSFKDRGMTVAISSALKLGFKVVAAASTGNTSASAAAYSARAGLKSLVLLPKGKVASGKLAQAIFYGSIIAEVEGNFDDALRAVYELYREKRTVYPLNSFNPWRLEGQKTIAFEIYEDIGVPDYVVVPVGNAGNIYAIWKGFSELMRSGITERVPKMMGVQAEGASPIATAIEKGFNEPVFFDNPETLATAIRIGRPVNWRKALKAIRESKGTAIKVSDQEIMEAQRELARTNGLGTEPASAASYAGLKRLMEEGKINQESKVVCILTGHALKDPEAMLRSQALRVSIPASRVNEAIEEVVGL